MNKSELISGLAELTPSSKSDAGRFLDALEGIVTNALAATKEVTIPGIGKLSVTLRAERVGRNPSTGESITIPAKKVVKFKATKALNDAVN